MTLQNYNICSIVAIFPVDLVFWGFLFHKIILMRSELKLVWKWKTYVKTILCTILILHHQNDKMLTKYVMGKEETKLILSLGSLCHEPFQGGILLVNFSVWVICVWCFLLLFKINIIYKSRNLCHSEFFCTCILT